jgi:hypothetical protein
MIRSRHFEAALNRCPGIYKGQSSLFDSKMETYGNLIDADIS